MERRETPAPSSQGNERDLKEALYALNRWLSNVDEHAVPVIAEGEKIRDSIWNLGSYYYGWTESSTM